MQIQVRTAIGCFTSLL